MSEGEWSDEVVFRTAEKAPSDFNFWTFFWTSPEVDPDAALEYVVLEPDGKEHFRHKLPSSRIQGARIRSDFKPGVAGGDPKVFFGQHVVFKFRVSKGKIRFEAPETFHFSFSKQTEVKATIQG
jgi:hypothetical protein